MNFFKSHTRFTDAELIDAYQKHHDSDVLGELYNRYLHLVYGLCLKYLKNRPDAQDATMEIYEVLADKLLQFEVTHFKSWLYIVARNHCLGKLRKSEKSGKRFMEIEDLSHPIIEEDDVDKDLDALEKCIEELKEEQKTCVSLFYLKQKSYQEIAEQTKFKIKKVKSYIQNGKRNLKICLEVKDVKR